MSPTQENLARVFTVMFVVGILGFLEQLVVVFASKSGSLDGPVLAAFGVLVTTGAGGLLTLLRMELSRQVYSPDDERPGWDY